MGHEIHNGMTGSGKTTDVLTDIIERMDRGEEGGVVSDCQEDSLALEVTKQGIARGHGHRIIHDRMSNTKRYPRPAMFRWSTSADPLTRDIEDESMLRAMGEFICARVNENGLASTPQVEEWWLGAGGLLRSQPEPESLRNVRFAFMPGTEDFDRLVGNTSNDDLAWRFGQLARLHPKALREEVGAVSRRISATLGSPAFAARLQGVPTVDLGRHLDNRGWFCVERGPGVSDDSVHTYYQGLNIELVRHMNAGAACPVGLWGDEWRDAGLVGPFLAGAARRLRKKGLSIIQLWQEVNTKNEHEMSYFNNCETKCFYKLGYEQAIFAARELLGLVDRYKVHHYQTQWHQEEDGYEEIKSVSFWIVGEKQDIERIGLDPSQDHFGSHTRSALRAATRSIVVHCPKDHGARSRLAHGQTGGWNLAGICANGARPVELPWLDRIKSAQRHRAATGQPAVRQSRDWDDRDNALVDWLTIQPATIEQIVQTGGFPSYETAWRRTEKLIERRRLKLVGFVPWHGNGRPRKVVCRWQPKTDSLLHEVLLTDFFLDFPQALVKRGKHVDSSIRPDGTMLLNGQRIHIEMDMATEGYRAAKRRFQAYKLVRDMVVWVTLSKKRMEGLMERAGVMAHCALFTILGSDTWIDLAGNRRSVQELSDGFSTGVKHDYLPIGSTKF